MCLLLSNQNISPFLVDLNPPANSSQPPSVDQILNLKMFVDINTIDVSFADIETKRNSRGRSSSAFLVELNKLEDDFSRSANKKCRTTT